MSGKKYQLISPEYEIVKHDKVLPEYISVYPLVSGLSSKLVASAAAEALDMVKPELYDHLPEYIRKKYSFPSLSVALSDIHAPQNAESLKNAMKRMAYDELFCFALALHTMKKKQNEVSGPKCPDTDITPLTSLLPYTLTNAQKRVIEEISNDMKCTDSNSPPMSRILIGDVGSGKTICAAAAIYTAVKNGYQCAFMVPTEVLATQHFTDLVPIFEKLGIKCELLLGSTKQKDKNRIYASIQSDENKTDILIGTHALLNDKLVFSNLGLIITDEQHRFGANQRSLLKEKNKTSHMLVMSATPIPRSLALTLYGDLSVSVIDEMPKGRERVDTFAVDESYRARMNGLIRKQVESGGQVYIVCPAIEESEANELTEVSFEEILTKPLAERKPKLKNIIDYTKILKEETFHDLRIEFLHGKMKPTEKDEVMKKFSSGEIDILVSTTVIEVGVNVPNASLMIVENAERFGLSQLHQLRGRVGRGTKKSYCILVSDAKGQTAKERLQIMKTAYDGYKIAEKDLQMRGPGDFFASTANTSIRQSGGLTLKFSSLYSDTELLHTAFEDANDFIHSSVHNPILERKINKLFTLNENTLN